MIALMTAILMVATVAPGDKFCGQAEPNPTCQGPGIKCGDCTGSQCANPTRYWYNATMVTIVSDPNGCCWEESLEMCWRSRPCSNPCLSSCSPSGTWTIYSSASYTFVPGELCGTGANCSW